jgi:hypothetical protein
LRLRWPVAFDRSLHRLFLEAPRAWGLKGWHAIECRIAEERTSRRCGSASGAPPASRSARGCQNGRGCAGAHQSPLRADHEALTEEVEAAQRGLPAGVLLGAWQIPGGRLPFRSTAQALSFALSALPVMILTVRWGSLSSICSQWTGPARHQPRALARRTESTLSPMNSAAKPNTTTRSTHRTASGLPRSISSRNACPP